MPREGALESLAVDRLWLSRRLLNRLLALELAQNVVLFFCSLGLGPGMGYARASLEEVLL